MKPETLDQIRDLANRRDRLIARLPEHPDGLTWCENHTDLVDEILQLLYEDSVAGSEDAPPMALLATGGFGRRELSPFSDIDITIVPSDEASQALDTTIRGLFQNIHRIFHGLLKMEIGYAYRLISDAAGLDAKTRTGLLDMRLIAGSHDLVRQLESALEQTFSVGEFIHNKLTERDAMFRKFHDSPLVAEPHLKEGAGGLRCFHCSNWIRLATGERAARPPESYDVVVRHRNMLHFVAGKAQDHLSRQRQGEIAMAIGVSPQTFMHRQLDAAEQLHMGYRRAVERIHESVFPLSPGVIASHGEVRWTGTLDGGDCAVGVAIGTSLGLRVSDVRVPRVESVNGPAALYALSTGEKTLRNLDRCGLLEQLLPALTAARTIVPDDNVHRYSVFEHTMRAIRTVENIASDSTWGGIMLDATETEPLFLALLLHDVGRPESEADHPEIGAKIAADLCAAWGIGEAQAGMTEWLIRHHLLMSEYVRVRDLQNPSTISEFAKLVGDTAHLRLLTLLTYADVHAVDDAAWTSALGAFMWELYVRTLSVLEGDSVSTDDPAVSRQRLLRRLKSKTIEDSVLNDFVAKLPSYYLLSTPVEVVRLHLEFVQQAVLGLPTIEVFHRADINATEITTCVADRPGLLSGLLGVFYAFDLSVSGIRASTTSVDMPIALDVFTVSFNGKPVPSATSQQVNLAIAQLLEGSLNIDDLLRQRGKDPERSQRVIEYKLVPGVPSILELRCPRGRGMPYRLSRFITDQGWNVVSARVGQWAGNATAAFYLTTADGLGLNQSEVESALVSALSAH